jgi:hypothetical protein
VHRVLCTFVGLFSKAWNHLKTRSTEPRARMGLYVSSSRSTCFRVNYEALPLYVWEQRLCSREHERTWWNGCSQRGAGPSVRRGRRQRRRGYTCTSGPCLTGRPTVRNFWRSPGTARPRIIMGLGRHGPICGPCLGLTSSPQADLARPIYQKPAKHIKGPSKPTNPAPL